MATAMEIELRERITRLEAQVEHMAERMESAQVKAEETAKLVRELHDLFQQARGAKWAIVGMASLAGFLAGKFGSLATFFGGWMPK